MLRINQLSTIYLSFNNYNQLFLDKSILLEQVKNEVPSESLAETSSNLDESNQEKPVEALPETSVQSSDVFDHYRFILLIRDQFLKSTPFKNIAEEQHSELKCERFKTIFDNLDYHYSQMMRTFDSLSNEAKEITTIYKENV